MARVRVSTACSLLHLDRPSRLLPRSPQISVRSAVPGRVRGGASRRTRRTGQHTPRATAWQDTRDWGSPSGSGLQSPLNSTRVEEDSDAWVTPAATAPGAPPKGIIHFLGGAFAGAAPQLLYPLLVQLLAQGGYTVVATPFAVTFNHIASASTVHEKFQRCLAQLRASGRGAVVPVGAPVYGVGHSNGALLHLLIGSLFAAPNAGNALISFNNKRVGDAIPIGMQELQAALRSSRDSPLASLLPPGLASPSEVLQRLAALAAPAGINVDPALLRSIEPALQQINSVMEEVSNGTAEFTPSPAESRQVIRAGYRVPRTLLVRFRDDTIDESPEMAALLRGINAAGTLDVTLPGSHVTPCISDFNWQSGGALAGLDAVVAGVKMVTQADVRRLADTLLDWLDASALRALPSAGRADW